MVKLTLKYMAVHGYNCTIICDLLFSRLFKCFFFKLGVGVGLGVGLVIVLGLGLGTGLALGLRVGWVLCITARSYSNLFCSGGGFGKKNKIIFSETSCCIRSQSFREYDGDYIEIRHDDGAFAGMRVVPITSGSVLSGF